VSRQDLDMVLAIVELRRLESLKTRITEDVEIGKTIIRRAGLRDVVWTVFLTSKGLESYRTPPIKNLPVRIDEHNYRAVIFQCELTYTELNKIYKEINEQTRP